VGFLFIICIYINMKKLIVTTNQLDRLIPQEDIDFVKKYKEETGHYPNYRELQHNPSYVRDFIPSHQKKNNKLRTYVDTHLGEFLNIIKAKLSSESEDRYEGKNKLKVGIN